MANQALLIIDMINRMDFVGAENLYANTVDIVEPIAELKQLAKKEGIPVIYVNDNFGFWKKSYDELVDYCSDGMAKGWIDRLRPTEDDYFIYKPKHSGFYGTQLNLMLQDLGIEHLIMTGISGDMCVLFTAKDAYIEGYSMWVPENAMASEEKVYNEAALHIIHRLTSCDISKYDGKIHEA